MSGGKYFVPLFPKSASACGGSDGQPVSRRLAPTPEAGIGVSQCIIAQLPWASIAKSVGLLPKRYSIFTLFSWHLYDFPPIVWPPPQRQDGRRHRERRIIWADRDFTRHFCRHLGSAPSAGRRHPVGTPEPGLERCSAAHALAPRRAGRCGRPACDTRGTPVLASFPMAS
jgi:hypothetical protein